MEDDSVSSDEGDVHKSDSNVHTSDMDYLRSKIVKKGSTKAKSKKTCLEVDNEDEEQHKESNSDESDSDNDSYNTSENSETRTDGIAKNVNKMTKEPYSESLFTAKMRGLPFKSKEKDIFEFFDPLNVVSIRLPLNQKGKPSGFAYVDFSCEKDLKEALKRDKDYMKGRYIELFRDSHNERALHEEASERPWMKKQMEEEDEQESIAEVQ